MFVAPAGPQSPDSSTGSAGTKGQGVQPPAVVETMTIATNSGGASGLAVTQPHETESIGDMTTDPYPGEPGTGAQPRQLGGGEPTAHRAPMPFVEQRAGRDPPEHRQRSIGHPVPLDIRDDHGRGSQTPPGTQDALGLAQAEVVKQHGGDDVVERLLGERQMARVTKNDVDFGPRCAG